MAHAGARRRSIDWAVLSTGDLQARTRYEPAEVEPRIIARWLESGLVHPEPAGTAGGELLDRDPAAERHRRAAHGPRAQRLDPGHADPLRTACAASARSGSSAPTTPGIATQTPGREAARDGGHDARRARPRARSSSACGSGASSTAARSSSSSSAWARRCDYDDERFTLDERYAAAVLKVFVDLYDKGRIYRDHYMVNWDPGSRSAISDLEVEEREVTDTLYSIAYPLATGDGEVVVATVRPETMLADTAVAVHPDDERYAELIGQDGRSCRSSAASCRSSPTTYVKTDFGTGALKITPGHDPNDFEIGRRHGLEELTVDRRGRPHDRRRRRRFAGHDRRRGAQAASSPTLEAQGLLRAPRSTPTPCRSATARASASSRSSRCSGS